MEILNTALEALTMLFTLERMSFLLLGVCIGLIVGVIPGLGGATGMALVLPFIFGMEPVAALALLIGMVAVIHTSDTFPSVLLGIPGSAGSQATIMDGYPLARQGQAARALGAAFASSMMGGLIGAVTVMVLITAARPLVSAFSSPQLLMLTLMGLSMVSVLAKGKARIGILGGLLGMLIGSVGLAPASPQMRFTMDQPYLTDGISIPVLALAMFAIPELIDLLFGRAPIAHAGLNGSVWAGWRDAWKHKWLVVRSAILGTAVGIIPGLGGSVVDWLAYGMARQTSRPPRSFGEGDIRGVIAPEAANNPKEAGTLVPALLFGIPGSATSAMLLGGLFILGFTTGPSMVEDNLDVSLSIIWTLAIANVLAAVACFALARWVAKVSIIPAHVLVPFLFVIIVLASYQSSRHWGDIIALLVLGAIGWVLKYLGWGRVPLLIGFILAQPAERYLHLSMSRYGFEWLTFPSVIIIGVIIFLIIGSTLIHEGGSKRSKRTKPLTEKTAKEAVK